MSLGIFTYAWGQYFLTSFAGQRSCVDEHMWGGMAHSIGMRDMLCWVRVVKFIDRQAAHAKCAVAWHTLRFAQAGPLLDLVLPRCKFSWARTIQSCDERTWRKWFLIWSTPGLQPRLVSDSSITSRPGSGNVVDQSEQSTWVIEGTVEQWVPNWNKLAKLVIVFDQPFVRASRLKLLKIFRELTSRYRSRGSTVESSCTWIAHVGQETPVICVVTNLYALRVHMTLLREWLTLVSFCDVVSVYFKLDRAQGDR